MNDTQAASLVSRQCLVRFGWQQEVGRFEWDSPSVNSGENNQDDFMQRGTWVVVRSYRGLEIGQCLGPCRSGGPLAGSLLRSMQPEDEFLNGHLQQLSRLALERCTQWLQQNQQSAQLLEVEPLLDCRTLLFYFLADVDSQVHQYVEQLTRMYEQQAADSEFVLRVGRGCGPNCGTDQAARGGCGTPAGCSNCQVICGASSARRASASPLPS
ncbi:MAG: hypothetical protein KF752_11450 [Pirellulaceae bacterium]|nr:hypothetical protein [Pirellulaceae bacterium]